MKKLLLLVVLVVFIAGCAGVQSPVFATIYTKVKGPLQAGEETVIGSKVGKAECTSYLGVVAVGDASIQTACQSAGITRVRCIDYEASNILGIIATYTVIVSGD